MIHTLLQSITHELGAFLKTQLSVQEDVVVLSPLVNNADGSFDVGIENKLICTLVNIQKESVANSYLPTHDQGAQPSLSINLYVLFSAFYAPSNYVEALRMLSLTLGFFQKKSVFLPANTPSMPSELHKITVEMVNLDMEELSKIWAALGAKYMPSVLYKIRMIPYSSDPVMDENRAMPDIGTRLE